MNNEFIFNFRFDINFNLNLSDSNNIALHLSCTPNEPIIRNTRTGGIWGREELDGLPPFTAETYFKLEVTTAKIANKLSYVVIVNDELYCIYQERHGAEISKVKFLEVTGDVINVKAQSCKNRNLV